MSQSYSVTKVIPLPVSNVHYLNGIDKENDPIPHYETIGGILLDTKYVWTANGPLFTVINSKTGSKVAAWNFGSVVKDYSTKVVCVEELRRPAGKLPLLVIGLSSAVTGGMICIFDFTGSRILRAIQINAKVTSLHVIDGSYDKCPLPGPLRAFDGILSIGTAGGNVLLLDICRHTCDEVSSGSCLNDIRDEVNSCSVKTIFLDDIYSLELYKQVAIENGEHLAIHLNATDNNVTPHFILKGPKGDDRVHVNKAEVIISALHYCPQLGSLLVGYNFGAWQLWNLIDLQLVYTSPIYEENVPVAHFSIQEPSDDPRAYCYIWVVYSNNQPYHAGFPLAVLYSLNYDAKEWHEGYGILYQNLSSCSVRFQTDLTLFDEIDTENNRQGAYCLRLQSISGSMSKGGSLQELQEETIALCSIVWNGWSSKSNVIHTYMSLFDLNQWYKAQIPNSPTLKECGTYMTNICLSKLMSASNNAEPAPFLDLRIDLNTLSQFLGSHKLEEHYYPSSLAFNLCALKKNNVIFFNNSGSQRAFLSYLESTGPSVLLKPSELFQQSIDLGLYPLFLDTMHNLSLDDQRELILSIALEQQLLGWLCTCASVWSTGSYSTAGCTLQFLISWGWQRALVLKQNADKFSTPLFDYSGVRLDANNHNLLSNCARQLKKLSTFFGYIVKRFARFLLHPDVVKEQWESLQMVSVHLEVLQWLLNVGLLPECPISSYPRADEFSRISAPYPVESLIRYYDERRTHLQSINKEHFSTSGSLLFIDNLIELECGGQKVQKKWEEDDGNGLYPPPSLQALLRTYLIEGVEISFKHCIVVYVFLDLAMTLDQSRYKPIITHLIKFPAVFQLSPSIIKITQAFWQLDHGDFSTAMEQLLDPLVCAQDLKMWHHRVALKALLAQNQHKFALLYLQVRQPAITEVEDLCTVLSLYIVNDMLDDAFHFQRQNRSLTNEEKLLQHFFRECDKKGEISSVIHLLLTQTEEKAFMKYLRDVEHPKLKDLQVFYYIQRSQYVDAFELNDKLNLIKQCNKGLKSQDNMGFRDLMVKELTDTLPGVSKSLMKFCQEENPKHWKEVARPEPLSVFVHNTKEQAKYKSTIIHTVLSKAKETWTHPVLNVTAKNDNIIHPITEEMPFLNTPKGLKSESRIAMPVIFPKITVVDDEYGPSPAKRFKPSPRLSMSEEKQRMNVKSINIDVTCTSLCVKLDTPIVKRKVARRSTSLRYSDEQLGVGTPQSILKVYNFVRNSRSPDPAQIINMPIDDVDSTPVPQVETTINQSGPLSRKRSLGLTPRKPLPRTSRNAVRFNISRGSSESSITSEPSFEIVHDEAMIHSSLDGSQERLSELKPNTSQQSISEVTSKNSSLSVDDEQFYSADATIGSNTESKPTSLDSIIEIDESKVLNQQVLSSNYSKIENKESFIGSPRTRSSTRIQEEKDVTPVKPSSPPKTPKSRRSYRGSLPEVGIRSSPRLRKSLLQTPEKEQEIKEIIAEPQTNLEVKSLQQEESPYTPSKTKLRGRRPLSRQVLENNAFSKISEVSTSLQEISQSKIEVSYLKIETKVEVSEDSNPELKLEDEDLNIISSDIKLDETDVDSTNVSYNQLDVACTSDALLQSEENSVRSDRDSISPCEQNVVEEEEEGINEVEEENDKKMEDQENDFSDQEKNERKTSCDSDADTVVIEPDLLADPSNIYDDLSSDNNYGSTDPQMNVFEISDDLDLNEDMCVAKNVDILEIDINYTTSQNDEEVFADNSEVLTDLMPVTEYSPEQFEDPEAAYECNKTMQDLKTITEDITKQGNDNENEVIELSSSSEESDESDDEDTDQNFESSNTENSLEEEFVNNEQEENSDIYSFEEESASEGSDEGLPEENIEESVVPHKEVLSDSDYSRNSEIISDNNSRESYSTKDHASECEEIKDEEEISNEMTMEISEGPLNIGQLDVIPEESSNGSEGKESNSKSEEVAETSIKETDLICKTESFEDHLEVAIPEEASEIPLTHEIPHEKISDTEIKECTGLTNESCGTTSLSVEQQTVVGVQTLQQQDQPEPESTLNIEKNQSEETPDIKLRKTREWLRRTDVFDVSGRQSAIYTFKSGDDLNQSSLNMNYSNPPAATTDILDKSEYSKSRENLFSQTDVMDYTQASSEKDKESQEDNIADVSQLCDEVFKENLEKSSTPARRSRRLSSLQLPSTPSDQVSKNTRRCTSSDDVSHKIYDISQPSTSKDTSTSKGPPVRQLRGRSNSVEITPAQVSSPRTKRTTTNLELKEMPLRKRTLRSNSSTDVEVKDSKETETRTRRAASVHVELPVIKEELKHEKNEGVPNDERKQKTVKEPKKSKSTITAIAHKTKVQEYSTTRRLTRRQAVLFEKNLGVTKMQGDVSELHEHDGSNSEESDNDERGPNISKLDPIHLLDKPGFEGKRDSDEENNMQQSPPSSVPESPIGSQRTTRLRSRSSVSNTSPHSEVSTVASLSEAGVSSKKKLAKHPIAGISTRTKQRSKSVDETLKNKMPSPPKLRKTRRGSKGQDSGSSDISSVSKTGSLVETKKPTGAKRTRSASMQHLDEAGLGGSPLRRSERRTVVAKSELPQIIEEQNSSSVNTVPKASKRSLRKHSSAK